MFEDLGFSIIRKIAEEHEEAMAKMKADREPLFRAVQAAREELNAFDEKHGKDALVSKRDERLARWEPQSFGLFLHNERAGLWRLCDGVAYASHSKYHKGRKVEGPAVRLTFRRVLKSTGGIDTNKTPISITVFPFSDGFMAEKFPFSPYDGGDQ